MIEAPLRQAPNHLITKVTHNSTDRKNPKVQRLEDATIFGNTTSAWVVFHPRRQRNIQRSGLSKFLFNFRASRSQNLVCPRINQHPWQRLFTHMRIGGFQHSASSSLQTYNIDAMISTFAGGGVESAAALARGFGFTLLGFGL